MSETQIAPAKPMSLPEEILSYWRRWPGKLLFLGLAAVWLLLFQFLGNSTFGYIDTTSLFGWMQYTYVRSPDDEHGFLIPIVVLILAWWKRDELLGAVRGVWWPGAALLALALAMHIISFMVQQTRISIFAFYFGLYALMGFVWGRRFLAASFFPMVLFLFAVPLSTVSEALTYPLRVLVTKISVGIGHDILAMGIHQDGSQIVNQTGVAMYDVAPACSGIRSLTALGAVTLIYAFTAFGANWRRALIVLSAIPIAVAGNVGRVTTLLILGDVFGQEQAMRLEQYLGMVTFAIALGCLFLLGRWIQPKAPVQKPLPLVPVAGGAWGVKPWPAVALVLLLTAGTAVILGRMSGTQHLGKPGLKLVGQPDFLPHGEVDRTQMVKLPLELEDFTSEPLEVTPLELSWLPKDTVFGRRTYKSSKDGFWANLSVVLMGTDRTSIHKPQYCLEGQGWRIQKTETVDVPMQRPYPYNLRVMKLTAAKNILEDGVPKPARAIYVYWFVADNELTPFHGQRMWWMARDLIRTGMLQRWAYVSYLTVCHPGSEEPTFARLKEFMAATVPEFQLAAGERRPVESTSAALSGQGNGAGN